jgi:hypothetical protein
MNSAMQNSAPTQNASPLEALLQYKSSPGTPGTPCTPEGIESKKRQKRPIDDVENHENAENIKGAENAIPMTTFKLNINVAKNENGTTFWNRVGCGIAGADSVRGSSRIQEKTKKTKKNEKFPFPKF